MMDIGKIMKVKQYWNTFCGNHTKVPAFINAIKAKGFTEGQEIAIAIRYPDGEEYKTGIRVQNSDLELLDFLKTL